MKCLRLLPFLLLILANCTNNGFYINECYQKGAVLVKFIRIEVDNDDSLDAVVKVCNALNRKCATTKTPYEKVTFENKWEEVECPAWLD